MDDAQKHTQGIMDGYNQCVNNMYKCAKRFCKEEKEEKKTSTHENVTTPGNSIIIDVSTKSNNWVKRDLTLIVDRIEFLRTGRMRWHLSFWNKDVVWASMKFGKNKSYVSDEYGNKYNILNVSSEFLNEGVSAGTRRREWLEFESPKDGAKIFKLFLLRWTYGYEVAKFNPLEIIIPNKTQ